MEQIEELTAALEGLCLGVTEEGYGDGVERGYRLLTALRDLGAEREQVHRPLLEFHNGLEEGLARDLAADMLDFVTGWCDPERDIWREDPH